MQVVYLTGENIYLRPLVEEDADHATAWYNSPFPINAGRAKGILEEHQSEWWEQTDVTLVIARTENDEPIGGMKLSTGSSRRTAKLRFHMAPALPEADELRAEAVRIVVPWLRDEHEMMVVSLHVAADEVVTVAAAEELDMQLSVRLREFVARAGARVDELIYEALNPRWEVRDA
jgi:RimJ/RimL family protein N-acetyltransferase